MYIRFTVLGQDADSKRKTGILVAAHDFKDSDALSVDDDRVLRELLEWFDKSLPSPKPLDKDGNTRAISWFKPGARSAIKKMWELKSLLDLHDIHIEVHKTASPGTVIYEDEMQVVAKPAKGQRLS